MSSEKSKSLTKENLDSYLKELAKEYRRLNGTHMPAELTLVGGAAILVNYGFRNTTTDIDAIIHASSSIKDAINRIGDKYDLPNGWLNADFMRTDSYSPKLEEFSKYYRTFSHVLTIRTISAEYLIAMKLRSGRKYKNDLSDIYGILNEHEKSGVPISKEKIEVAVQNLYGGWSGMPEYSKRFIDKAFNGDYEKNYEIVNAYEKEAKRKLVEFEHDHPGVTAQSNVNTILDNLMEKSRESSGKSKTPKSGPIK